MGAPFSRGWGALLAFRFPGALIASWWWRQVCSDFTRGLSLAVGET